MKILVNGKEAVLKAGSSFEYVSENPLFTDAEDYSLEIEFPMKDCPQNILIFGALHVKGVDISNISFPCEIITESFDKTGILAITEVGDAVVKGQFLEGMSQQNFASSIPNTYITDIDFSDYDGSDGTSTSINRVKGTGWANMAIWDSKREDVLYSKQGWAGIGGFSVRHIYLYHLVRLIAQKVGYSIDDSKLMSIAMYSKIVVVNTTYCIFDRSGYDSFPSLARVLPHWTVKQFLTEVGNFFGCIPEIDSTAQKITFKAYSQLTSRSGAGQIVNLKVNDDFEVEMSSDESKYKGSAGFKLADECNPDNVNMCPWLSSLPYIYKSWKTAEDFALFMRRAATNSNYSTAGEVSEYQFYRISDVGVDAVVTKRTERNEEGHQEGARPDYLYCEYEVLNQFGDFRNGEELGIAPCPWKIIKSININADGSFNDSPTPLDVGVAAPNYKLPVLDVIIDKYVEFRMNDNVPVETAMETLKGGEEGEKEYYKKLWVVLHTGVDDAHGYNINTRKYEAKGGVAYSTTDIIYNHGYPPVYYHELQEFDYTLSPIDSQIQSNSALPSVDESKLYRYKFLSKTLPDPKAIYVIKGKEYACLRLTAHFTVDGMSELIEGEFYEIVG